MAAVRGCRSCCAAAPTAEPLRGPPLEIFKLIFNTQTYDGSVIVACQPCREFLKEIHRFRVKCNAVGEIYWKNLDVKPHEVEIILKNAIENNPADIDIKTEVIDEFGEVDQIDIQINKVEVDYDPEGSPEMDTSGDHFICKQEEANR